MNTQDFQQFHEGIIGVMSFYGKDVSRFALDIWWNALKQFDLAAINDAFGRHLMNPDSGQYPPKPADIVRMLQGSTQDSALQAWVKVDKAVRQVGTGSSVVFDDPLIHRVLQDMGGWLGLGSRQEDEWPFVAREFENRYRGYKMRSERPEYAPIMIGGFEAANNRQGYKSAPPTLIGNRDHAMQVMAGGVDRPLIGFTRADAAATRHALHLVHQRETA